MDKILRVGGHHSQTKGTRSPKLTVVILESTLKKLQNESQKQGLTISEIVRLAIRDYLNSGV